MIAKLVIGLTLVALTVTIHAGGLALILSRALGADARVEPRFWPVTWLLVRVAWLLVAIHSFEIAVWAMYFWRQGCLPDIESAFYFAGVTYATIGYGDLVLPNDWRLFGPLEGLVGILMCGLSTGFFFALVTKEIASPWIARNQD